MLPSIVLADNLTGACEVAGIAHRAGLKTRLSMDPEPPSSTPGTLVVVDTETRRLSAAHAAARMMYFAAALPRDAAVFLKCDSTLRGPIAAEAAALASHLRRPLTLLVPANPALNRRVHLGRYKIGDLPLHQTPTGKDPVHPAFTDVVVNLLGGWDGPGQSVPQSVALDSDLPASGLAIGDTVQPGDLAQWAKRLSPTMLPAGSAAFFARLLPPSRPKVEAAETPLFDVPTLLLSGTNSPSQRALLEASPHAVPLHLAEIERRGDSALTAWKKQVVRQLKADGRAIVYVDTPASIDPATQGRITCAHAFLIESLASKYGSTRWHLVIEGGLTAASIAAALGRRRFGVQRDWSEGVVTLAPEPVPHPWFTLKPGSYPWPQELRQQLFPAAKA